MIRVSRFVAALLASPIAGAAQRHLSAALAAGAIRASEIDGHLRFLSHDLVEGRATAAPDCVAP